MTSNRVGYGTVVVGQGVVRLDFNRTSVIRQRFVEVAQIGVEQTAIEKVEMQFNRIGWSQFDGLVVIGQRVVRIAAKGIDTSAFMDIARLGRVEFNSEVDVPQPILIRSLLPRDARPE